ncbi:MAG: zinc ribbon domain-containing protein [Candidatus Limnocylindrales bacterium]
MPIYDYACSVCGQVTEVIHGVYDSGPKLCPACGAENSLRKAINAPAIHYRGSGWAKKDRSATSSPGRSRTAGKDSDGSGSSAADASGQGDGESAPKKANADAKGSTSTAAPKPSAPAASSGSSGD